MEKLNIIDLAPITPKCVYFFRAHIRLELQSQTCLSCSSRMMGGISRKHLRYRASLRTRSNHLMFVRSATKTFKPPKKIIALPILQDGAQGRSERTLEACRRSGAYIVHHWTASHKACLYTSFGNCTAFLSELKCTTFSDRFVRSSYILSLVC